MLESYSHNPQADASPPSESRDDNFATLRAGPAVGYRHVWSPERDAQLIALMAAPERWSHKQIGHAMGLSADQVRARLRVLHLAGIEIVRPAPPYVARRHYTRRDGASSDRRPWPDADAARLAGLWDEGLSTREIGLRLGRTKNAVVGMAHRLGLAARPSPVRRTGEPAPAPPPRVRVAAATLPPLRSVVSDQSSVVREPPEPVASPTRARSVTPVRVVVPEARVPRYAAPPPPKPPPAPRTLAPRPWGRITECCWPLGEPGTRAFRFCDAPSDPGRPYCPEHARTAFVAPPRRARTPDDSYARPI
jgi:GcrA cell cycle regulator